MVKTNSQISLSLFRPGVGMPGVTKFEKSSISKELSRAVHYIGYIYSRPPKSIAQNSGAGQKGSGLAIKYVIFSLKDQYLPGDCLVEV